MENDTLISTNNIKQEYLERWWKYSPCSSETILETAPKKLLCYIGEVSFNNIIFRQNNNNSHIAEANEKYLIFAYSVGEAMEKVKAKFPDYCFKDVKGSHIFTFTKPKEKELTFEEFLVISVKNPGKYYYFHPSKFEVLPGFVKKSCNYWKYDPKECKKNLKREKATQDQKILYSEGFNHNTLQRNLSIVYKNLPYKCFVNPFEFKSLKGIIECLEAYLYVLSKILTREEVIKHFQPIKDSFDSTNPVYWRNMQKYFEVEYKMLKNLKGWKQLFPDHSTVNTYKKYKLKRK